MKLADSIQAKLEAHFAPRFLELINESHLHAGGAQAETHFRLVLVADAFKDLPRLDRQRRVMDLLQEERQRGLHALTLRVLSPAEWESVKENFVMESPACRGGSKREGL